jgi:hypothetical protein
MSLGEGQPPVWRSHSNEIPELGPSSLSLARDDRGLLREVSLSADSYSPSPLEECPRWSHPFSESSEQRQSSTHLREPTWSVALFKDGESTSCLLSHLTSSRLLSQLSSLVNPSRVLELGTFTGYATLCLAEGMSQPTSRGGEIVTIDKDPRAAGIAQKYFQKASLPKVIFLLLHPSFLSSLPLTCEGGDPPPGRLCR